MPCANWKGASVGMIVSHITILSITFGHLSIDTTKQFLPTSIDGCTNETFSSELVSPKSTLFSLMNDNSSSVYSMLLEKEALVSPPDYSSFPQNLFSISYMYYSLFGTMITVFVGIIVSLFTRSESDSYDSKFVHPIALRVAKWFPGYEKLFTDEKNPSDLSTSEPNEQHFNDAFDHDSENIPKSKSFHENEVNSSKFQSNLVYKSDKLGLPVENYKKLSEE